MRITVSFCLCLYLMLSADVSVVSDIRCDSSKKHEYCLEILLGWVLWCLGMAGIFPGCDCVSAFGMWQPQAAFPTNSMRFYFMVMGLFFFFNQSSLWIFLDSYRMAFNKFLFWDFKKLPSLQRVGDCSSLASCGGGTLVLLCNKKCGKNTLACNRIGQLCFIQTFP